MKESKKEWLPERLLINKGDVEKICNNYLKSLKRKDILYAIIGGLISYIITISFEGRDLLEKPLAIAVGIGIAMAIVYSLISFLGSCRKEGNIENNIYNVVARNMDHTAVFLIGKRVKNINGNQEIAYMTQKHGIGDSFLVFLKLNDKKGEFDLEDLKERLAIILGILPDNIHLQINSSYNFIKRTAEGVDEKLIRYEFIMVYFDKCKVNEKSFSKEFEWKTLDMLKNDVITQKFNHDVIDYIQKNIRNYMEDSFKNFSDKRRLKIIWNITNKCEYHCSICATYSDRKEMNLDEKMKALLSVLTIIDQIGEIDFSGGDPLSDQDSRCIIKYAQKILGKENVCVTTTGKGIKQIANRADESADMLYNCEITIDDVEDEGENIRNQKDYCDDNIYVVCQNKDKIHNLIVNVPILNPDMQEEKIKEMVNNIAGIPIVNKKIILIRLMQVGKLRSNYPDSYDPKSFIEFFKRYAEDKNIEIKLQCALRGKYEGEGCNMLEEKIGIDCAGNVFTCAWGGYIGGGLTENPFYLGNLLEKSLSDILQETQAFHIRDKMKKRPSNHCCVFSCVCSENGNFASQKDPLFSSDEKD